MLSAYKACTANQQYGLFGVKFSSFRSVQLYSRFCPLYWAAENEERREIFPKQSKN